MARILGFISLFILILLCLNGVKVNPKMDKVLKKHHTSLVIALLITSLVHGVLSGKVAGMISGKIAWFILLISLFVLFFMKKSKHKMKVHHIFSLLFFIVCMIHILFLW